MKTAAILSLGALALAAPTSDQSQGTKISYSRKRHEQVRRDDGSVDLDWFKSTLKSTLLKYNKDFALPDILQDVGLILKRDTDAEVKLTDGTNGDQDTLYYGPGQVGSAKQVFTFDFDTGSSDTFVPSPKCGTGQGCEGSTKYNNRGQAQGNTTTVTYGSGQVTGDNYFDSVTVGGLTASHQTIISLTNAQGFSGTGSDSLMGMGFQSIANSKQPPFFFSLINQKKVSPTEFSFYLGRQKSGTAQNSEMTLGGRDETRYRGAFTSIPVTKQGYWQVAIDGASVGTSNALPSTSGQAAIDTGTTWLIAPTAAARSLFSQIPGSVPINAGSITLYAYPCSTNPSVSLIFSGKKFAINNLDFNMGAVRLDSSSGLGGLLGELLSGGGQQARPPVAMCLAGVAGADVKPGEALYGTNGRDFFAPAASSRCSGGGCHGHSKRTVTPVQLEDALRNKKACFREPTTANPFIFTTPSLLFALLLAFEKQKAGEEVYITSIERSGARTPSGQPVRFKSALDFLSEYRHAVNNSDGSLRTYEEVVFTTDCIKLGGGSRTAKLRDLEDRGLTQLYPALQEATSRGGLNVPWEWLQDFWFRESALFSDAILGAAANVANSFVGNDSGHTSSSPLLFASVLGLRKREANDMTLRKWWLVNSTMVIDNGPDFRQASFAGSHLPDVQQCRSICNELRKSELAPKIQTVSSRELELLAAQERDEWRSWFRNDRRQARDDRKRRQSAFASSGEERGDTDSQKARHGDDGIIDEAHGVERVQSGSFRGPNADSATGSRARYTKRKTHERSRPRDHDETKSRGRRFHSNGRDRDALSDRLRIDKRPRYDSYRGGRGKTHERREGRRSFQVEARSL